MRVKNPVDEAVKIPMGLLRDGPWKPIEMIANALSTRGPGWRVVSGVIRSRYVMTSAGFYLMILLIIGGYRIKMTSILYRNIHDASVEANYRFGINVVVHLLTRYQAAFQNLPLELPGPTPARPSRDQKGPG